MAGGHVNTMKSVLRQAKLRPSVPSRHLMLRHAPRITHRVLIASKRGTRAESTSAPPTSQPPPSSASATNPSVQAPGATSEGAAPKVETPSPIKKRKLRSPADPAADYQRLLEERFGGGEAAALGELVDGKPQGLAKHVKNNMFRLI